jgi:hypothetical protein
MPQVAMKLLVLASLIFISGCGLTKKHKTAHEKRIQELNAIMNPLVGADEDAVVEQLGAPDKISEAGNYKIYHYRKSLGARHSTHHARNLFTGESLGFSNTNSWEAYDEYRLYFKGGVVAKWDGYVQR